MSGQIYSWLTGWFTYTHTIPYPFNQREVYLALVVMLFIWHLCEFVHRNFVCNSVLAVGRSANRQKMSLVSNGNNSVTGHMVNTADQHPFWITLTPPRSAPAEMYNKPPTTSNWSERGFALTLVYRHHFQEMANETCHRDLTTGRGILSELLIVLNQLYVHDFILLENKWLEMFYWLHSKDLCWTCNCNLMWDCSQTYYSCSRLSCVKCIEICIYGAGCTCIKTTYICTYVCIRTYKAVNDIHAYLHN